VRFAASHSNVGSNNITVVEKMSSILLPSPEMLTASCSLGTVEATLQLFHSGV
jgi:hypothetical protein